MIGVGNGSCTNQVGGVLLPRIALYHSDAVEHLRRQFDSLVSVLDDAVARHTDLLSDASLCQHQHDGEAQHTKGCDA